MKRRPKRRNFKIPSKPGRKKAFELENSHDETKSDRRKELDELETLKEAYRVKTKTLYNSLVPDDMMVGEKAEFVRASELNNDEYFSLSLFENDILFSILESYQQESLESLLKLLIDNSAKAFDSDDDVRQKVIDVFYQYLIGRGFEPGKRKVFLIIQEEPTEEFLERDQIIIDPNDKFFKDYAGNWADFIIGYFNEVLGTTDVIVKVINEKNRPKEYRTYLEMKHLSTEIEDLKVKLHLDSKSLKFMYENHLL